MRSIEGMAVLPRLMAHGAIRFYQLTISSVVGRQCRHAPTCSSYTDEAIARHGLWAAVALRAVALSAARSSSHRGSPRENRRAW